MSFSSYHLSGSVLGLRSMRSGAYQRVSSGGLPKLKSTGLSKRTAAAGSSGSSFDRDSIKQLVSQIIGSGSDVSDAGSVSDKADQGLTKDYVAALEAQAKQDAEAGVYGKDGKAAQLREEQMKQYVSPDRDSAIAQANKLLVSGALGTTGSSTAKLTGLPYTATVTKGISGITAALYDENGEKFASYDSKSGKWTSVTTKAESQFQTASSSIYDEAYRAAEAAKKAAQSDPTQSGGDSGLDVRA